MSEVEAYLGLKINVIDGDQEAYFICEGVRAANLLSAEKVLIMDIGGGSTEFIITDENKVYFQASYLLGVTRLLDQLQPQNPITVGDINRLNEVYENTLQKMVEEAKSYQIKKIIGSSGSFDTLAEMQMHRLNIGTPPPRNGFEFQLDDLHKLGEALVSKTTEERLEMAGMIPMRADMIHLSYLQVKYLLDRLPIENIVLSNFALKEGVLNEINKNPEKWPAYYL